MSPLERGVRADKRITALVCDDDASTRFAVKRLLSSRLACTVLECADGVAALERLKAEPVDVLLLDIEMPVLSGVEVLRAVRASAPLANLPVVMMSKERREDIVRALVQLGIDGYVLKPLRAERVLETLEPLMSRLARRVAGGTGQPPGGEGRSTRDMPLAVLGPLADDLSTRLRDAGRQVCGMMLDTGIDVTDARGRISQPTLTAVVGLTIEARHRLVLSVCADDASTRAIAARMLGTPVDGVRDEDCAACLTELVSLIAGRLRELLDERGVSNEWAPPRIARAGAVPPDGPLPNRDLALSLSLTAIRTVLHIGLFRAGDPPTSDG